MRVTIHEGRTLWDELNSEGYGVARPCNGSGRCGGCKVIIEGIGEVLSCEYREPGEYDVTLPQEEHFEVLQAEVAKLEATEPVYYVDLGTTTIAGVFADGEAVKTIAVVNPQRRFGADVMTRIEAANQGEAGRLKELVQSAVLSEIDKDCKVYVSGNSTMQHLFEGLEVRGLGVAPYRPVTTAAHAFNLHRRGVQYEIRMLEGISAFVGADIVSGIRELQMDQSQEVSLLIDLGTNGEMALGNAKKMLVTSTAAGPAFEANALAMELHASGLIRILSYMKENGIMDSYGTLRDEYFVKGYQGMTQELIRELQMAKAAIRAGIEILVDTYGIAKSDIAKVYLAGGMGQFIDVSQAIAIGLLPMEFEGRTKAVGNTSLLGAIHYGDRPWHRPEEVREIILAEQKDFEEHYIRYMNF